MKFNRHVMVQTFSVSRSDEFDSMITEAVGSVLDKYPMAKIEFFTAIGASDPVLIVVAKFTEKLKGQKATLHQPND